MRKNRGRKGFTEYINPGIRAQLLNNKHTMELAQDFVIEGDYKSTHVLNTISHAFTCSFPVSSCVVDKICEKQGEGRLVLVLTK